MPRQKALFTEDNVASPRDRVGMEWRVTLESDQEQVLAAVSRVHLNHTLNACGLTECHAAESRHYTTKESRAGVGCLEILQKYSSTKLVLHQYHSRMGVQVQ